jgi:hypothetical protein
MNVFLFERFFMVKRILFLLMMIVVGGKVAYSQQPVEVMSSTTISDGPLTPMWLWANQWGRFDEGTEVYARVGDTIYSQNRVSLVGGIGGVYRFNTDDSYLHEGFLSAKYYNVTLAAGLQAYSPWSINDRLTSGMYLGSANARPIPRISAGLYNYVNVPFTKGWLQVKGGISQGILNDYQQMERGHNDDLFHEKFGYVRLSHFAIKPYAGLMHSAIYGGENIPADFWATFFAQGSSVIGGGEETNAAGAHMGLFDFGFDWQLGDWKTRFYFQKPFADGSGMYINWGRNKDFITGFVFERNAPGAAVNGFAIEWVKTDYQSGPGMPDPYDPELVNPDFPDQTGVYFFPGSMDNPAAFMAKYYPDLQSTGWTRDDIVNWLEDKVNQGYEFGGRDDNMNNGMYYAGWSYYGRSTGTPLYHSADQVRAYAPDWAFRDEGTYFVNNRINGAHFSLSGQVCTINYLAKATFIMNYGSYSREYFGRSSWQKTDDYFYKDGLFQGYYGLELNRDISRSGVFNVFANIGVDQGQLYDSWGVRFGLVVRP